MPGSSLKPSKTVHPHQNTKQISYGDYTQELSIRWPTLGNVVRRASREVTMTIRKGKASLVGAAVNLPSASRQEGNATFSLNPGWKEALVQSTQRY